MPNSFLVVDSRALMQYTKALSTLHRSGMPNAIRNTLNKAAFDVKTNTMPAEAGRFVHRTKNFFKANSKVETAKGFDVKTMVATVGFVENSGNQQQAVEDMKMQDEGGTVKGRTYIPTEKARVSNSNARMVRTPNRMSKIKGHIVDSKGTSAGKFVGKSNVLSNNANHNVSNRQQFIRAAIYAEGHGGLIIGNFRDNKGNRMLWRIKSMIKKDGKTMLKLDPIYTVKEGRAVHEKATHFFQTASQQSAGKMEGFFIQEASKQIAKLSK